MEPDLDIFTLHSVEFCKLLSSTPPFRPLPPFLPSTSPESCIQSVERIIGYDFKNRKLLEEALTHSSYTGAVSYQRLEFIGDAALGLVFSNYVFLVYPDLDPGQLSLLRAANISTEKLARVAVRHGLYHYVRRNAAALDDKVREFTDAVSKEEEMLFYGGSVKAPKVLADIVESVAAAVYVDVNFDLEQFWVIFRGLLEPIITLEDLKQHPVTMLFEFCQKNGKQVDIRYCTVGLKNIARVYIDGKFVASGESEHKETAKLNAVKGALLELSEWKPTKIGMNEIVCDNNQSFDIENAKQKLHELCRKRKWPKPIYSIEKDEGPAHGKKFICSVQIATLDGVFSMMGDEKSKVKDAESSAASLTIRALNEADYL